ncbi:hypothetical protein [Parasphingorhabdus pacifica]
MALMERGGAADGWFEVPGKVFGEVRLRVYACPLRREPVRHVLL